MQERKILSELGLIKNLKDLERQRFMEIFNNLKKDTGCTYLYYFLQNLETNKTIIQTSNEKWQSLYVKSGLMYSCPITKLGINLFSQKCSKSYITYWKSIKPSSKDERSVHDFRNDFDLINGFSFTRQNNRFREAISFASEKTNYSFIDYFFEKNILEIIISKIRRISFHRMDNNTEILSLIQNTYNRTLH